MNMATQPPTAAEPADSCSPSGGLEAWLVAAVTVAIAVSTLVYVYLNAFASPWSDEWRWVPTAVGEEPPTAEWFCKNETGHCLPLTKLAYLGTAWATGVNFRAIALASVLLLAATATAMTLAVARSRGSSSALDVFIPIALLNWGHYMSLLWGFQLCYVLPVVLACMLLLLVSQSGERLLAVRAVLAGGCAAAAALCGGAGIFFSPVVAVWLVAAGLRRWRENRAACVAILAAACIALLPLKAYLGALPAVRNDSAGARMTAGIVLRGTLQFLSMSVGKFGGETYPVSGLLVAALAALAAARLVQVWRRCPQERIRAAGLGLFLAGGLGMALGIGLSRGHIGCLQNRYSLLGAPLILCLYLVGTYYGPPIRPALLRRFCVAGLLVLVVLYDVKGMRLARDMYWNVLRMEASVQEGLPPAAVAVRHWEDVQAATAASLRSDLELLRAKRVGPYRGGLALEQPRDVAVRPMLSLQVPHVVEELKSLASGEELVQSFLAASDGPLFRIDVGAYPARRASGRLLWSLDEIDASGRRRTWASGEVSLDGWRDPAYAQLAFAPFTPLPGGHCELRLCPEGGAGPLLNVAECGLADQAAGAVGLRAFVYYQRAPLQRIGP
jgi:hypothetical protein